jgi:hypothetical protein
MRKIWLVCAAFVLTGLLAAVPAFGQTVASDPSYDQSTFMGGQSQGQESQLQSYYYPYWHNYLDRLQQQGGYYAVTGTYPNSIPVTSYYPSTPSGEEMGTAPNAPSSAMYSAPGDYQSMYGQGGYPGPTAAQPTYQPPAAAPQGYQPPSQGYAAYHGTTAPQQVSPGISGKKRSASQKRRLSASQATGGQVPQAAYPQQQAYAAQQPYYGQPYGQPQAGQPAYPQQAYGQPQQPYPDQQQAYAQQPGYPQAQGQPGPQQYQPQAPPGQPDYTSDPTFQQAQQKAYERAVARQRAAEMAAQQQAAIQEMQQARNLYESTQQKVQEEEARQRAFQEEYRQKALREAYDNLRVAQQRYYEMMGVSGASGGGATAPASAPGPGQPQQYPQMAAAPPQVQQYPQTAAAPPQVQQYPQTGPAAPQVQQYPQTAPTAPQGYPAQLPPGSQYSSAPGSGASPQGMISAQAPSGPASPLHVQPQQQESSGSGFWGILKEIFSPPTNAGASQRHFFDKKRPGGD